MDQKDLPEMGVKNCRSDLHLFIFFLFFILFGWPLLSILEKVGFFFDFICLFAVWLLLIFILFVIVRRSIKQLEIISKEGQ